MWSLEVLSAGPTHRAWKVGKSVRARQREGRPGCDLEPATFNERRLDWSRHLEPSAAMRCLVLYGAGEASTSLLLCTALPATPRRRQQGDWRRFLSLPLARQLFLFLAL